MKQSDPINFSVMLWEATYLSFLEVIVEGELELAKLDLGLGALGILIVFHVDLQLIKVRLHLQHVASLRDDKDVWQVRGI